MTFEPGIVIGVMTVVFFAVLGRATFGFGEALVSMPIVTLLVGLEVARPFVAIVAIFNGLAILAGHWQHLRFRSVFPLVVSSFVGIALVMWLLQDVTAYEAVVKAILGVIVIAFALFKLIHPERIHLQTDRTAIGFGLIAGILAGAYNTPGPPIVVYGTVRRWTPDQFRATFQGFALPSGMMVVIGHGISGAITSDVLSLVVVTLPVCAVAIFLGRRLSRHIKAARFSQILYILLLGIGLWLVIDSIATSNGDTTNQDQTHRSVSVTASAADALPSGVRSGLLFAAAPKRTGRLR